MVTSPGSIAALVPVRRERAGEAQPAAACTNLIPCRPAVPHSIRSAYSGCRFRLMSGYGTITMSVYGTEQPVCLAVDPVGEVQDIGAAVVDAVDPEGEGPEAASPLSARVDRDRAVKRPVARDKGIDLAMEEAEVADQHIIAEPAETGRCDGNPPGGGEAAAGDQFPNEVAVFIEDSHDPLPQGRLSHVVNPGRCIGHVNVAADVLHVERD